MQTTSITLESLRENTTALLRALRQGVPEALDQLMPHIYEELRRLAHHKLQFERNGHTLNTTALVHEAYLKLSDQRWERIQDRVHFFAIAAQAMRRILVSHARKRNAVKRGKEVCWVPLDELFGDWAPAISDHQAEELVALDAALKRLEVFNERGAQVVEYRYFAGMTYEEVAEVMGLSPITIRRAWTLAKMWLQKEIASEGC